MLHLISWSELAVIGGGGRPWRKDRTGHGLVLCAWRQRSTVRQQEED